MIFGLNCAEIGGPFLPQYLRRKKSLNVQKYVVIHPAARRVLRQWPSERFAIIAKHLWEKYAFNTILVGTKDEIDILENVKSGQDFVKIWIANDSLLTLYKVIQGAELVIWTWC